MTATTSTRDPMRLADFVPTTPAPPTLDADPHRAGRLAQLALIRQARQEGREPRPEELDEGYWSAYRTTSQWGDL